MTPWSSESSAYGVPAGGRVPSAGITVNVVAVVSTTKVVTLPTTSRRPMNESVKDLLGSVRTDVFGSLPAAKVTPVPPPVTPDPMRSLNERPSIGIFVPSPEASGTLPTLLCSDCSAVSRAPNRASGFSGSTSMASSCDRSGAVTSTVPGSVMSGIATVTVAFCRPLKNFGAPGTETDRLA